MSNDAALPLPARRERERERERSAMRSLEAPNADGNDEAWSLWSALVRKLVNAQ
jgi:hypothetical protein